MKKLFFKCSICFLLFTGTVAVTSQSFAQVQEAKQLALDIQKLIQLKKILQNMIKGVEILTQGYNKVKQVTHGNYTLHEAFLDGLLEVSPAVRKYRKVADIIRDEGYLITEYKNAFNKFKDARAFTPEEIDYMGGVYGSLIKQTEAIINELTLVITSGKLRMSDGERLSAIDRIYKDIRDKLTFLRGFNLKAEQLAAARNKALQNTSELNKNYGIR